jgi:thiamine biosynthesis lipoprotein
VNADPATGTVTRPRGVKLDPGGIAKGLFADLLAVALAGHPSFAVDCGGDIRLGGTALLPREVRVASPFEDCVLHTFERADGAVATSGIGKRSWIAAGGRPAHHLIDPATGAPAFTGIVQVTALAPTGVIAEALSKAAILSGPEAADRWLTHGGVVVYDDGSHRTIS